MNNHKDPRPNKREQYERWDALRAERAMSAALPVNASLIFRKNSCRILDDFAEDFRGWLDLLHQAYTLPGEKIHGFNLATGIPAGGIPPKRGRGMRISNTCIRGGLYCVLDYPELFSAARPWLDAMIEANFLCGVQLSRTICQALPVVT